MSFFDPKPELFCEECGCKSTWKNLVVLDEINGFLCLNCLEDWGDEQYPEEV